MSNPSGVIHLREDQLEIARDVLTQAFQSDPMFVYVVPDPIKRMKATRAIMGAVLAYTLGYGDVYTTPDVAGVAAWLPPGKSMNDWRRHIRTRLVMVSPLFSVPLDGLRRAIDASSHLDKARKRMAIGPYWYLSVLGVSPAHQHQGVGSALLRPVLEQADAASVPCYLETQSESNVSFYTRHGFEVVEVVRVPGGSPPMWAMLKKPRGA